MAKEVFAIGALAYNFMAIIIAPLIGIEMQPIEWGNPPYKPMKPGETPKHPAEGRSRSNSRTIIGKSMLLNQSLITRIIDAIFE